MFSVHVMISFKYCSISSKWQNKCIKYQQELLQLARLKIMSKFNCVNRIYSILEEITHRQAEKLINTLTHKQTHTQKNKKTRATYKHIHKQIHRVRAHTETPEHMLNTNTYTNPHTSAHTHTQTYEHTPKQKHKHD